MSEPAPADLRVRAVPRGAPIAFTFDGRAVVAHDGETVATALAAAGCRQLGATPQQARARGLFCAIGACFECLVVVDGGSAVRACLTPVQHGMVVTSLPHGSLR